MYQILKKSAFRRTSAVFLVALQLLAGCSGLKEKSAQQAKNNTEFNIAVIPDTQFYTAESKGGNVEMFRTQIRWIREHCLDSNIVYVSGMGDIVNDNLSGKEIPLHQQWINAVDSGGYYALEKPLPGMPHGIPYGLAVGNHDQATEIELTPQQRKHPNNRGAGLNPVRNTTFYYNKYFGVAHFKSRPYYGGNANLLGKNNNDCHFDRFTVGGQSYVVVYISYDNWDEVNYEDQDNLMIHWADSVVKAHPKAKAIIVSHGMLKWGPLDEKGQNPWNPQGLRIYEGLKANKNILMFLCGHVKEGYREEVYDGHTIRIFMNDYQGEENGGNGMMRTFKINTMTDSITVRTFSPYLEYLRTRKG